MTPPPAHIAIIMDGNGRWAKERGMTRSKGHERGSETVRTLTTECAKLGIRYLTLYAFSTENWRRPKREVDFLMKLLTHYLSKELKTFKANNIRFRAIGDLSSFSAPLQTELARLVAETAHHTGLTQVLALNYGSRDELVRAAREAASIGPITEESLENALDTACMPPVDMLIRTGGDLRLSNFLLWQAAYAELFFTPTLWPDFTVEELQEMIAQFHGRERRFGGVSDE